MPYEIKKVPGGYKVRSKGTGRYFSKKPLSYERARKQQQAIYLHVNSIHGGNENDLQTFIETYMKHNDLNMYENNFSFTPRQTLNDLLVYLIVTLGEVAERSKATDC